MTTPPPSPTAPLSSYAEMGKRDAQALRLLREGASVTQVIHATGITREHLQEVVDQGWPREPRRVPHFTTQHRLATKARAHCNHDVTLRLAVACGPCWERVIQLDAIDTTVRTLRKTERTA